MYPQEQFRGTLPEGRPERPDLLQAVRVGSPEDCPLYSAHILTGVKIGPSPAWMQDRLRAVGVRPINNVVDVGNYVMLEFGQPLHAFDARKLAGGEIIVRRAADGERLVTLDGKERILNGSMLVIADAARPVVIAGIMGGENSGVAADTTDLVLECAIFRRQSIRATSKRLALSSDSSYRYERGVDPHTAIEAAHRAVDLILASAGGRVAGPIHQVGGDVPWQREIVVTPDYLNERLGFAIPDDELGATWRRSSSTSPARPPTPAAGPSGPSPSRAGGTTSTARSTWWRKSCGCTAPSASRRPASPPWAWWARTIR